MKTNITRANADKNEKILIPILIDEIKTNETHKLRQFFEDKNKSKILEIKNISNEKKGLGDNTLGR